MPGLGRPGRLGHAEAGDRLLQPGIAGLALMKFAVEAENDDEEEEIDVGWVAAGALSTRILYVAKTLSTAIII